MLRIGLTGGIGSGKTTVASLFAELGVPVIDADVLAHELTKPGEPATAEILSVFGPGVADNGGINRALLAQRVFGDPDARKQLEAILHPRIRAAIHGLIQNIQAPYCLLVIPLLVETQQQDLVDRILVVDSEDQIRLSRVQQRDGRSEAEIRKIMQAQVGRKERLAAADDRIINENGMDELKAQVRELHDKYLLLACTAPGMS